MGSPHPRLIVVLEKQKARDLYSYYSLEFWVSQIIESREIWAQISTEWFFKTASGFPNKNVALLCFSLRRRIALIPKETKIKHRIWK